jgi:hypothetical protein
MKTGERSAPACSASSPQAGGSVRMNRLSKHALREEFGAFFHGLASRSVDSMQRIAERLGWSSHAHVARVCSGDKPLAISDVLMLEHADLRAVLDWIAGRAGLLVVELPHVEMTDETELLRALAVQRETSQAALRHLELVAEHQLDSPAHLAEARRENREAMVALAAADAALERRQQRGRVRSIRPEAGSAP